MKNSVGKKHKVVIYSIKVILASFLFMIGCNTTPALEKPIINNPTKQQNLVHANEGYSFASDIVLSQEELLLDKKISQLRQQFEQNLAKKHPSFYHQSFHNIKPIIDSTLIFKIMQKIPKGALLHTHSSGVTDAHWIIRQAKELDNNIWGVPFLNRLVTL